MQTNHNRLAALADARTNAEGAALHDPTDSFADGIRTVARRLIFSCPDASTDDKQFLQDVARAEIRYPMKALERLTRISQQSRRPEHREALAELVREYSTPCLGHVSVAAAFDEETRTNGDADMAQRFFEREPSPANRDRVLEALHAQAIATREAMTAVRRHRAAR